MDLSFLEKYQVKVPGASVSIPRPQLLPKDFNPLPKDIICGRGKAAHYHCGNRRFRIVVAMNLRAYVTAKTKADKSSVVNMIVDVLRESSPHGAFLRRDSLSGRWMTVDDLNARQKVGHAMRDAWASTLKANQSGSLPMNSDVHNKQEWSPGISKKIDIDERLGLAEQWLLEQALKGPCSEPKDPPSGSDGKDSAHTANADLPASLPTCGVQGNTPCLTAGCEPPEQRKPSRRLVPKPGVPTVLTGTRMPWAAEQMKTLPELAPRRRPARLPVPIPWLQGIPTHLVNATPILSQTPVPSPMPDGRPLPSTFQPSAFDVICGCEKVAYHHPGNQRLRAIIAVNLKAFVDAKTTPLKAKLVNDVYEQIISVSSQGGFVARDCHLGRWILVDELTARCKVGHALRDAYESTRDIQDKEERLIRTQRLLFGSLNPYEPFRSQARPSQSVEANNHSRYASLDDHDRRAAIQEDLKILQASTALAMPSIEFRLRTPDQLLAASAGPLRQPTLATPGHTSTASGELHSISEESSDDSFDTSMLDTLAKAASQVSPTSCLADGKSPASGTRARVTWKSPLTDANHDKKTDDKGETKSSSDNSVIIVDSPSETSPAVLHHKVSATSPSQDVDVQETGPSKNKVSSTGQWLCRMMQSGDHDTDSLTDTSTESEGAGPSLRACLGTPHSVESKAHTNVSSPSVDQGGEPTETEPTSKRRSDAADSDAPTAKRARLSGKEENDQKGRRPCVPLRTCRHLPSDTLDEVSDQLFLPDMQSLANYPENITKPVQYGKKRCVMCDKSRCYSNLQDAKTVLILPRNNKGVCTACEAKVWVLTDRNLEIKWCKTCKEFRPWAAFLDDEKLRDRCAVCRWRVDAVSLSQMSGQKAGRGALTGADATPRTISPAIHTRMIEMASRVEAAKEEPVRLLVGGKRRKTQRGQPRASGVLKNSNDLNLVTHRLFAGGFTRAQVSDAA